MGPCIAGGAYLPALSDIIIMVEGTSFMGLGGANLVKGATGQTIDNETLGGARAHNELSGVAHYRVKNDEECLAKIREDRKSTRLNSSHANISYAVFCLKKKKINITPVHVHVAHDSVTVITQEPA